eukprot:47682-Eustigmatos_ZCMA.PRE.1
MSRQHPTTSASGAFSISNRVDSNDQLACDAHQAPREHRSVRNVVQVSCGHIQGNTASAYTAVMHPPRAY